MPTLPCPYPRWERQGRVSRFCLGPGLPIYEVKECALIGGALFVASTLDTAELIGQFESEHNAQRACARDYAQRAKARRSPHESKDG
jgi:hypothetical protein